MNQAEVSKLVSQLKCRVNPRLRKLRNPNGPEGRLDKLRKTVTALVKYERIELNYPRADEARMYAERLISDAIRYGDCHKTTMEMADYWLTEKQLVHKLFKVLAPRYQNYGVSFTRMYRAPTGSDGRQKALLELRGNPYPPIFPDTHTNRNLIHNVLLDEVRKEYRAAKYAEIAARIDAEAAKLAKIELETKGGSEVKDEVKEVLKNANEEQLQARNKEESQVGNKEELQAEKKEELLGANKDELIEPSKENIEKSNPKESK